MDSTNKEKEIDQREKITATNIIRTGHFYFGKKRTFLNWFDNKPAIDGVNLLHIVGLIPRGSPAQAVD
ncbi:MAG: hypothetical protein KAW82_00010 [Desulfurellaceae bacterium]|nr:hypothetical protein [Desulfurellaceae bacterium]